MLGPSTKLFLNFIFVALLFGYVMNILKRTPLLDQKALLAQYHRSANRLVLLDYDGTLTPIVQDPQAAIPTDQLLRTLQVLSSDSKNTVWVISGRDQAFLDLWLGSIPTIGLSAEHGAFARPPGATGWENLVDELDLDWQQAIIGVFQAFTDRTPGSFIERKRVAVTWHFRKADTDLGARHAGECKKELEGLIVHGRWHLEVMNGKMNLEVRPVSVDKGSIAKRLLEDSGKGLEDRGVLDFVLCVGDDVTDEGAPTTPTTTERF